MTNIPQSKPVQVFLGMGTNKGDRLSNLQAAIRAFPPDVMVIEQSPVYQTPPWGYTDQPDYLNMVIAAESFLSPVALLNYVKLLEQQIGRTDSFRWGPREIDIDILDYGNQTLELDGLTLPHPRIHERAFVLVPLADLAPGWVHPVLNQTISDLLSKIDRSQIEIYQGA